MSDLNKILKSLQAETMQTLEMLHHDAVDHLSACMDALGNADMIGINVHGRLFTDRIKDMHEVVRAVATKLPALIETLDPELHACLNVREMDAEIGYQVFKHDHLHRTAAELEEDHQEHTRECSAPDCIIHGMYLRLMRERASLVH